MKKYAILIVITLASLCLIANLYLYLSPVPSIELPNFNKKNIPNPVKTNTPTTNEYSPQSVGSQYHMYGYYTTYRVGDYFPEIDNVTQSNKTCSAFIILEGEVSKINGFKDLIKNGNSINHINTQGNLILTLETERLTTSEQTKLYDSTISSPVTIYLKDRVSEPKDAYFCNSIVNLISVTTSH